MKRIPLGDGSALAGATVAAPLFDGRTKSAMARAAVKTRRPSEKPFKSRPVPQIQLHSTLGVRRSVAAAGAAEVCQLL